MFDIQEYKKYLSDLAVSNEPVFQQYALKVQEKLFEFETQQAELWKAKMSEKWRKSLVVYSESSDTEVTDYASLILSKQALLNSNSITLDEFKTATLNTASQGKLDMNGLRYIRENIIKLFE